MGMTIVGILLLGGVGLGLLSRRYSKVTDAVPWPSKSQAIFTGSSLPDILPGEPGRQRPPTPKFVAMILLRILGLALLVVMTGWLWPLYWLAAAVYGWPPNVPRIAQVKRYLFLTWTVSPPPPGLPLLPRIWITLSILRKVITTPVWGLAWLLDEILYGSRLRATQVVAPLIEISAARSGSTQLARYLEEDPHLVAPSVVQALFPYLWLWKLVPITVGRFVTPQQVTHKMESMLPPEFLERHEGDPFRSDTFDGALYIAHLNHLCPFLGPDVMVPDFGFGTAVPHNRALWERDFVAILDGVARKVLLNTPPTADGVPRRFFIKGHFLAAADALARRYPDARFLTIVRNPASRIQSGVNFLRANPVDDVLGSVAWVWLGETLAQTESDYCIVEQKWFSSEQGPRRCVIRFSDYVKDLEQTMAQVYRECLDCDTLPPHVPRQHPPRQRTNYILNRSLAQVGIDERALNHHLADYIVWCKG